MQFPVGVCAGAAGGVWGGEKVLEGVCGKQGVAPAPPPHPRNN